MHIVRKLKTTELSLLTQLFNYKNVDESFRITENLDKTKFEIWYLSDHGKPKVWYKYDKFFNQIPHEQVIQIYEQCDILLKSS